MTGMTRGCLVRMLLALLLLATTTASSNENLVLPPLPDATGPAKLLVLVPGANVATSYYNATARAIQAHTHTAKLWVVVPKIPGETCIAFCPSPHVCAPLHALVEGAVAEAGAFDAADRFLAGHSLGGVCAATLAVAYDGAYAAAAMLGSYVTDQNVAAFPLPVLTLGAELDGGLGRPGYLSLSARSSDAMARDRGVDSDWQLKRAPVVILPGLDHSSFCPGFRVPGDVWPAEVGFEAGADAVGTALGAFLSVQMTDAADAYATLRAASKFTRALLAPLHEAMALERDGETSPWCEEAQRVLAGPAVAPDLDVAAPYFEGAGDFEHSRVRYAAAGYALELNVSGHNAYYSIADFSSQCVTAAKEVGCKLASGARVAQQLNATSSPNATCRDVNAKAVEAAFSILAATDVGARSLARYRSRGRGLFLEADAAVFGDVGPLFIAERLRIGDNASGMVVTSLALGPQPLDATLFPGVHYCKLLSPARVVDYVLTDALKNESTCLNT